MKTSASLIVGALMLTVGNSTCAQGLTKSRSAAAQTALGETIEVIEASYGKNRRSDASGNATKYLKEACDGRRTCGFAVSRAATPIGDIAPDHTKDFDFAYLCGDRVKKGHIQGESVGEMAFLSCAR